MSATDTAIDDHPLKDWLRGVRLPSTRDDVVDAAEQNGAPAGVLGFLRSLPEAIFESEHGLEHVLSLVRDDNLPEEESRADLPPMAEDGGAS